MPPRPIAALLLRAARTASLQRPYSTAPATQPLLQQLRDRGLVETVTGADGALEKLIESGPVAAYAGVDPTASSLHVGHLLPLMNLLHFYLNGHHAIALIGKATASVGDPSGRTTERDTIEARQLETSSAGLRQQIVRFFDTAQTHALARGYSAARFGTREMVSNAEWLDSLGLVAFLGTAGKHVRVGQMLARESVKGRMDTGQGINFAEFTYQLLQSYDFWHLHHFKNCRLQIGGNDQFGNITAGIDLIHKLKPPSGTTRPNDAFDPAYGLTVPLLTTPSGTKLGKSAGNAIWLDARLTSPFELYQFFVRLPDDAVARYLRMFTLLPLTAPPHTRAAQHLLAAEVVALVHGAASAAAAAAQTRLLFPTPADARASAREILAHFADRVVVVPRAEAVGELVAKLARRVGAVGTRGEADNMIKGGGLYVGLDNVKVVDVRARVVEEWLLDGEVLVVRFGKGKFVIVRVV